MAAAAGADYVGVILAPGRTRSQTLERARAIYAASPGVQRVGVFVDADTATIVHAARALALDVIQLHGEEPPAQVRELAGVCDVWKASAPRTADDVLAAALRYGECASALLFDGGQGGSGVVFDWSLLPAERAYRVVLAGGLDPGNVARAIALASPDVVDVSSGVEERPGVKSGELVRAFVAAARGEKE